MDGVLHVQTKKTTHTNLLNKHNYINTRTKSTEDVQTRCANKKTLAGREEKTSTVTKPELVQINRTAPC